MPKNLARILSAVKTARQLYFNRHSFLYSTGWLESMHRGHGCDRQGQPLPWMNYAVQRILDERLTQAMNLFEYGSGSSTLFFAQRVAKVVAVEHDKHWCDWLAAQLPQNAEVIHRANDEDGLYCRSIRDREETFQVIIVDGWDRRNCLLQAVQVLPVDGVIILDDSERDKLKPSVDALKAQGFRELPLYGPKPMGVLTAMTSIFYRDGNCLGL